MKNILLNINKFRKEHKFLFLALVISWLVGLFLFFGNLEYRIRASYSYDDYNYLKLFLQYILPPIAVSLISFVACKIMQKYPHLTKWISAILNIGFIIYELIPFFAALLFLFGFIGAALMGVDLFNEYPSH